MLCVDRVLVWEAWPIAAPFIERSYARNKQIVPNELLNELRSGAKLLWLAVEAEVVLGAIITGIYPTTDGTMCKALECGGDKMQAWLPLLEKIEQYAKAEGCGRVIIEGRPGWARVLDDYRTVAVVLEKRI